MIKPDPREAIWYDIQQMLSIDPDAIPHYWTLLKTKFQMMRDDVELPFCLNCNNFASVYSYNKKLYCYSDYQPVTNEIKIYKIIKLNEKLKDHIILKRTTVFREINKVEEDMTNFLEEPNGYKMSLFELESHLFRQEEDAYFETRNFGDINKGRIRKELLKIHSVISSRLALLRDEITFISSMRVPPISFR